MKQSVIGILLAGIEHLSQEKRPEKAIMMKLINLCLRLERNNRILNRKAVEQSDYYMRNGFFPILLKGQGVAILYPKPEWRMPGDIDLWLADGRKKVTEFIRKQRPEAEILYHHIHLNENDGMEVEVHTVPTLLYNPFSNRKLQKWFAIWKDRAINVELPNSVGTVSVPCDEMNRVFLLIHKYRHLFCEGIGLRQMVDYMMLLRKGFIEEERVRTLRILKDLHLTAFCRAVMFVLTDALEMEKEYLLMEPDEKAGKLLLNEIITAGNFGKYDTRINRSIKGDSLKSFYYRNKRNILITGGAGFIGSHVVRLFVNKYPEYKIINLDKLTYAGNLANLKDIEDMPNYVFVKADICDYERMQEIMKEYGIDGIIHLAAESHVDRSIKDPFTFALTNDGYAPMLQTAKLYCMSLPVYC